MIDDHDDDLCPDAESRARTYLANERTFLAWFRTALALVALGLGAGQFLTRDLLPGLPLRRSIAIAFIASGILAVLAGLRRYFRAIRHIEAVSPEPAFYTALVMTALLIIIAILAIVFIVLLGPLR